MNFSEIFTNRVSATLKSINYTMQDGNAQKIDCHDVVSPGDVEQDKIKFVITRNVSLDALNGYTLEISVEIVRFAKNDIDLTNNIKEADFINIAEKLSDPVMNYVSHSYV